MNTTLDNFRDDIEAVLKRYDYTLVEVGERLVNNVTPLFDLGKTEPVRLVAGSRYVELNIHARRLPTSETKQ